MSAMLEPGTDFTQPLAVAARVQAQLLFNRRVDEDAGNFAIFRRQLDKLADLWLHSDGTTCLPSLATRSSACSFQQLGRCPARLRQLKEDIDIEARLVAGVPAVKAPARRHPHVANQHGSHSFIVHLITQALNKLNQIRMTEVATLIGTHHLIAGGTQGSASAPTIQPLENAPIDWALPPIGWVIFCHGVAARGYRR